MAAPLSLEKIIRDECMPVLDCMLTVTDTTGESAFLYFKEGELVEANFASLWGRDALTEIINWTITSRAIAPLPLGIKRSLWEPLEDLLRPEGMAPSGNLAKPQFKSRRLSGVTPGALDRFKAIPKLLRMVEIGSDKETVLFDVGGDKATPETTDWLVEFAGRVRAVGETLGFGSCEKWTIETERNQIVGFARDSNYIALVRAKDAMQEDLETTVSGMRED
jgi:hypothetical protein